LKESNARITSTTLGYEDHGIMTWFLDLDYGGSGQGAGGYVLNGYDKENNKKTPSIWCGKTIMAILDVLGVDKWEALPGTYIRVKYDYDKVHAIGHLLKDQWLDFDIFFFEGSE